MEHLTAKIAVSTITNEQSGLTGALVKWNNAWVFDKHLMSLYCQYYGFIVRCMIWCLAMKCLWFKKALKTLSGISIYQLQNWLLKPLFMFVQSSVPVNMQIDIAPQHHLFIIGRNGINIKQIMQRTGAKWVTLKNRLCLISFNFWHWRHARWDMRGKAGRNVRQRFLIPIKRLTSTYLSWLQANWCAIWANQSACHLGKPKCYVG